MRLTGELIWQTDVPVEECASRIQRATERDSAARWFRFGDQGTVYSTINGRSFRLFAKGPAFITTPSSPTSTVRSPKRVVERWYADGSGLRRL